MEVVRFGFFFNAVVVQDIKLLLMLTFKYNLGAEVAVKSNRKQLSMQTGAPIHPVYSAQAGVYFLKALA